MRLECRLARLEARHAVKPWQFIARDRSCLIMANYLDEYVPIWEGDWRRDFLKWLQSDRLSEADQRCLAEIPTADYASFGLQTFLEMAIEGAEAEEQRRRSAAA